MPKDCPIMQRWLSYFTGSSGTFHSCTSWCYAEGIGNQKGILIGVITFFFFFKNGDKGCYILMCNSLSGRALSLSLRHPLWWLPWSYTAIPYFHFNIFKIIKEQILSNAHKTMIPWYFKIDNIMYNISIPAMSMACSWYIWAISGHHSHKHKLASEKPFFFRWIIKKTYEQSLQINFW